MLTINVRFVKVRLDFLGQVVKAWLGWLGYVVKVRLGWVFKIRLGV